MEAKSDLLHQTGTLASRKQALSAPWSTQPFSQLRVAGRSCWTAPDLQVRLTRDRSLRPGAGSGAARPAPLILAFVRALGTGSSRGQLPSDSSIPASAPTRTVVTGGRTLSAPHP